MIKGNIKNTVCRPQDPFVGEIVVEKSDLNISSIELQLMRIEIITGNYFLISLVLSEIIEYTNE